MVDLSALGAASAGVWTRPEALALLRPGQVDHCVRTGTWQVLWRGVYTDGGTVPTSEQRAMAAVLAVAGAGPPLATQPGGIPRAVASARTAARVWQLPLIDDDDPATGAREHRLDHVAVLGGLPPQRYAGRSLRTSGVPLSRRELVRRAGGVWVTSPARTLLDCARVLSHEALVCAVDAALHRELVDPADLWAYARCPRLRGAAALRVALDLADQRAESPAETLTRLLLLPALPGLVPQVELVDAAGRLVARLDLGDREVRLAVEVDGKRGHAGTFMVAKDRRRDRRTDALGWTTERVTWFELRREQAALRYRILARHAELRARRCA